MIDWGLDGGSMVTFYQQSEVDSFCCLMESVVWTGAIIMPNTGGRGFRSSAIYIYT